MSTHKKHREIFTALIRLQQALRNNDTAGIQRAIDMLDSGTQQLDFVHAELGANEQGLDAMKDRLSYGKYATARCAIQ